MLIPLLLGEAYYRFFEKFKTPETDRAKSIQYSPSLFARHVFPLKEQFIEKRGWLINKKGYRGNDFSRKKDGGTIRVIAYGGSTVFDINATNGKDWPSRLEHLLKENDVRNIEVINAGIPGHASFDSFGRLFAEGHIFEPDYVIFYNAWNDIKYFSSNKPLLRNFKPFDDSWDYRISYAGGLDQMFCELSQLYVRLIRKRYFKWKYHIGIEGVIQSGEHTKEVNELGLRQYRLNVEMFVDIARNINAIPILVTQARLVARNNTAEEKSRIGYDYQKMKHKMLVKAFEKTDDIIINVAKSKHVTTIIDASKLMSGKGEYFNDHVHLSDKGSDRLAIIISEYLLHLVKEQNTSSL